jgi:hypothetical protein
MVHLLEAPVGSDSPLSKHTRCLWLGQLFIFFQFYLLLYKRILGSSNPYSICPSTFTAEVLFSLHH